MLYDLGVVSTAEPFQRLVSQGMILGEVEYTAYRDPDTGLAASEDAPGAMPYRCALTDERILFTSVYQRKPAAATGRARLACVCS